MKRYALFFLIFSLALVPLYSNAVMYDEDGTPIFTEGDLNTGGSMEITGGETTAPDVSDTVYVTNTGKKYHRGTCRWLSESKIPISREEAKRQGYAPCSECNP